jgi:hypothetical protein
MDPKLGLTKSYVATTDSSSAGIILAVLLLHKESGAGIMWPHFASDSQSSLVTKLDLRNYSTYSIPAQQPLFAMQFHTECQIVRALLSNCAGGSATTPTQNRLREVTGMG